MQEAPFEAWEWSHQAEAEEVAEDQGQGEEEEEQGRSADSESEAGDTEAEKADQGGQGPEGQAANALLRKRGPKSVTEAREWRKAESEWQRARRLATECLDAGGLVTWEVCGEQEQYHPDDSADEERGEEKESEGSQEGVVVTVDSDEQEGQEEERGVRHRAEALSATKERVSRKGTGVTRKCRKCHKVNPIGEMIAHGAPPKTYTCADVRRCVEGISS